jgi:hypothetical protein
MLYWNEIIIDLAKILTWFCSTCFYVYITKLNIFYVWAFCHTIDINTNSSVLSKQTGAYPLRHLQQLL